jgi:E3 ubiquitin-protein ligase DOA10
MHFECVAEWISNDPRCPICKAEISPEDIQAKLDNPSSPNPNPNNQPAPNNANGQTNSRPPQNAPEPSQLEFVNLNE